MEGPGGNLEGTLDPGGNDGPTGTIAMLRDVSDRVERRREFEATVERLNRFAGIVYYDLQNPPSIAMESHP